MNMTILENKEFIRRFWSKVDVKTTTECWNWKASTQSKGYGSFGIGTGKTQLSHRIAYMLEVGSIPDGLLLRHKCDNKLCCNPAHLELGTIADNNRDAVERGRNARGEKNGQAKLTVKQVQEIRELHQSENHTAVKLARMYKVHPNSIYRILRKEYWDLPLVE